MDQIAVLSLGILIGCAATALYFHAKMLTRRVAELEEKLKKPGSLPFQTREEIEHAMAAMILMKNDLDFKLELFDNVMSHLTKARGNGKVRP